MAGDGTEQDMLTEGRRTTPPDDQDQPAYGDQAEDGDLLTLDPKKAAALNYQNWKLQPKEPILRRRAEWQVNAWRREGRSNVYVQKTQDKGVWQAWEPPWTAPPIPVLNKADRLCRRLKNMMFADPPVPEAIPSTGDDEDKESAIQSVRILNDVQSESGLDDVRTLSRAFDRASVYGSGFIRYYLDERGGGYQPIRIMAKAGAVDANTPALGPNGEELPGEYIARYVSEEGQLQDTGAGAAMRWVPGIRREILDAPSIRFLPHDAEDIWDADGVIIGTMPTWGELEQLWPDEMKKILPEDKEKILAFKPERAQDMRGLNTAVKKGEQAERPQDKRVAVFTSYHKAGPLYPRGCYFIGLANVVALHRQPWQYEPEDGAPEALDIPITQVQQFDAGYADPFGLGLMHLMGNANELRASQVGHLLQYLDQFANRRTFVPTNSIIQPKQMQLMSGAVIPINPGGKPEFEDIPAFPSAPMELFALTTEEMDDHAMMKETAQGTDKPSVQSGKQAGIIIQQAMASLSEIRQKVERAYIRACRIEAQLIRMGYTVPQQIGWTGEDGQYRQQWWTGSDLRGTADFKLKQGSLSMMTPEQKMNMAVTFQQLGVYNQNPDLFYDAITSTMGPVVGLEDDPSRSRIKRQLAAWGKGPPEGWLEQQQAQQQQFQMASQAAALATPVDTLLDQGGPPASPLGLPGGAGPASPAGPPVFPGGPLPGDAAGAPLAGQPPAAPPLAPPNPAEDPALASIFEGTKADEIQDVAVIRLSEMKRFMASTRYTRWPPEWRSGLDAEFDHMKLCAGVATIPEQQQAAQDQQAQALQQQQAQSTTDFQHQVQLEELKQQGQAQQAEARGNGAGKGEFRMRVKRDPTGRVAELTG